MKPYPPGHPFERVHFKGPKAPPPPSPIQTSLAGQNAAADAQDATRRKASRRMGIQSTILAGAGGLNGTQQGGNSLLSGIGQ